MIKQEVEKHKITFLPPLRRGDHGWLVIGEDKRPWQITSWHHFADFGATQETVQAERDGIGIEVYSMDEGESWTWD